MPLYSTKKYKDGSAIAIWEITESEEVLQQSCALPGTLEKEIALITNENRRKERLAVQLLLNHLLNKKVYLSYQDNGRPFLQNEVGDISITHTKRFAAVIYHPTAHVGIDIENTLRNFSSVEKRIISNNERDYLPDKNRNIQLCIIWAAKEALFKRICESGVDFSKQLDIERFLARKKGALLGHYTRKDQQTVDYKMHYLLMEDHAMVWVVA